MDPLFGFIDDLSVQHQVENSTGVGEYTISYPADQSEHYQIQHHSNSQHVVAESSGQLVHVVSENSQNEKQIYVIKLDNFLKDDGNPGDTSVKFEGADVEQENDSKSNHDDFEDSSSGSSSVNDDDTDDKNCEDESDEGATPGPNPFLVIAPEAVMAMVQSVGVDLNEDDASELGCIAMNKLRHAVLMAMQFSQNENSEGITVEHFAKAEQQLGSPGVGHESIFRETAFKYAGGVSVIDDGPEVDLYASIHQQNISQIYLDNTDPILNVHHLRTNKLSNEDNEEDDSEPFDQFVAQCGPEKDRAGEYIDETDVTDIEQSNSDPPVTDTETTTNSPASMDCENNDNDSMDESHCSMGEDDDDSTDDEALNAVVNELLNELSSAADSDNDQPNNDESEKHDISDSENTDNPMLAPEWVEYFKMLIEQVVIYDGDQTSSCAVSSDFRRILTDIRKHGLHPTLPIVCDAFRDYLRESTLSQGTLMNILYVADALISSDSQPTFAHMTDLGCLLIEIIILPPPCQVHQFLTQVFMKVMKNCNELLTWTCTYVTELLKGIAETPFDKITDPIKSTMHGALCLANGLEELNIQVAQEFGWHSSVLNFSGNHSPVFDAESYEPTSHDSFLEEEILKFFHNFMKNYTNLVPPLELSRISECITTMYGERLLSFPPFVSTVPAVSTVSATVVSNPKSGNKRSCCVFRKIVYKDKEIVVPYRKVVRTTKQTISQSVSNKLSF